MKKVLITGADGFIGLNLQRKLQELKDIEIVKFTRENSIYQLSELLDGVDFIFHLAGANRPKDELGFTKDNTHLTNGLIKAVVNKVQSSGRQIPILFSSSTQVTKDNLYGETKLQAEEFLLKANVEFNLPIYIFRLPNVFGKWSKPNYNSVVATFCFNLAHNLPIQIHDPTIELTLVYIDDVIEQFIKALNSSTKKDSSNFLTVEPQYKISVGHLAQLLKEFSSCNESLQISSVGHGLNRALYSTYVSFLPVSKFNYKLRQHKDMRGVFVEMLRTSESGQFSFFTAYPGVTRGGHYHHTKTEKFLVIQGRAKFRFRNLLTQQYYELETDGENPEVVETIPGWTHDITNIGSINLIVMLWANEIYDREYPDTFDLPI